MHSRYSLHRHEQKGQILEGREVSGVWLSWGAFFLKERYESEFPHIMQYTGTIFVIRQSMAAGRASAIVGCCPEYREGW